VVKVHYDHGEGKKKGEKWCRGTQEGTKGGTSKTREKKRGSSIQGGKKKRGNLGNRKPLVPLEDVSEDWVWGERKVREKGGKERRGLDAVTWHPVEIEIASLKDWGVRKK